MTFRYVYTEEHACYKHLGWSAVEMLDTIVLLRYFSGSDIQVYCTSFRVVFVRDIFSHWHTHARATAVLFVRMRKLRAYLPQNTGVCVCVCVCRPHMERMQYCQSSTALKMRHYDGTMYYRDRVYLITVIVFFSIIKYKLEKGSNSDRFHCCMTTNVSHRVTDSEQTRVSSVICWDQWIL